MGDGDEESVRLWFKPAQLVQRSVPGQGASALPESPRGKQLHNCENIISELFWAVKGEESLKCESGRDLDGCRATRLHTSSIKTFTG